MRLIIDSHLDLAWNALAFNRDLLVSIDRIRKDESGLSDEGGRGHATVSLPEMRRGGVAVCLGTLLVRTKRHVNAIKRSDLDFRTQEIAFGLAQGQLAYYRLLEQQSQVRIIHNADDLRQHWTKWREAKDASKFPIGIIVSMEGADPIVSPQQVPQWWNDGLRVVGLAHYGQGIYAAGTGGEGGLTETGPALLRAMSDAGMILDLTHTTDRAFFEAIDQFPGPVLASHNNCRSLVKGGRQMTDEQLGRIIQRGGVIGAALDNWMLTSSFEPSRKGRDVVTLASVADHIDHVCQLAGNRNHAAIGSDLDGGFGTEQSPRDLETIADLQKLADVLSSRGYSDEDITAVFHGNWLRFFLEHLPRV